MNIVNYSIDSELIGCKSLGTRHHHSLRTSLTSSTTSATRNALKNSFENSLATSTNDKPSSHRKNKSSIKIGNLKEIINNDHFTSRLPKILKEHEFDLRETNLNKIFTAQWLDERKVIMGTKCNKLLVLDTYTGKYSVQNPLKSHEKSRNTQNHCGIHSISINPSRTLLATGAEHVNDVAIYSLPSLEPVCVGYNAHSYWIFDTVWLDDNYVVSGAGDNRLALWKINSNGSKSNRQTSNYVNKKLKTSANTSTSSNSTQSATTPEIQLNQTPLMSTSFSSSPYSMRSPSILSYFQSNNNNSNNHGSRAQSLNPLYSSASSMDRFTFKRLSSVRSSLSSYRLLTNSLFNSRTSQNTSYYNNLPFSSSSLNMIQSLSSRFRYNFRYDLAFNQYTSNSNNSPSSSSNSNWYSSSNTSNNLNENNISDPTSSSFTTVDNDNGGGGDGDDDDDDDDDDEPLFAPDTDPNMDDLVDDDDDDFNANDDDLNNIDEENSLSLSFDENSDDLFFRNDQNDLNDMNNNEQDEDDDSDAYENVNGKRARGSRSSSSGLFKSQHSFMVPTKVIKCKQSKRIRALAYNPKRNEIAAISMNAAFHYFDVTRFEQKYTKRLSPLKENVCLSIDNDYSIYAIGSASHVQLLDANNARQLTAPIFIKKDIGVRSLHFRNSLLSIGTGVGTVLFYDLRANKFLNDYEDKKDGQLKLQSTGGWIMRNESYYENLSYTYNTDNSHAIYAHSYDPSGTRLLTVGGPLTVNLYGHYAGIWI